MGRTKMTVPIFIDTCKLKGYQKGFLIMQNGWMAIKTPRNKKGFDRRYEEIHKDYERYNNRKYRGYSKCKDIVKTAIKKNSKMYEVLYNKKTKNQNGIFVFRERTESEQEEYKKKKSSTSKMKASLSNLLDEEMDQNPGPSNAEPTVDYCTVDLQTVRRILIAENIIDEDDEEEIVLGVESSPGSSGYQSCSETPIASPNNSEEIVNQNSAPCILSVSDSGRQHTENITVQIFVLGNVEVKCANLKDLHCSPVSAGYERAINSPHSVSNIPNRKGGENSLLGIEDFSVIDTEEQSIEKNECIKNSLSENIGMEKHVTFKALDSSPNSSGYGSALDSPDSFANVSSEKEYDNFLSAEENFSVMDTQEQYVEEKFQSVKGSLMSGMNPNMQNTIEYFAEPEKSKDPMQIETGQYAEADCEEIAQQLISGEINPWSAYSYSHNGECVSNITETVVHSTTNLNQLYCSTSVASDSSSNESKNVTNSDYPYPPSKMDFCISGFEILDYEEDANEMEDFMSAKFQTGRMESSNNDICFG